MSIILQQLREIFENWGHKKVSDLKAIDDGKIRMRDSQVQAIRRWPPHQGRTWHF